MCYWERSVSLHTIPIRSVLPALGSLIRAAAAPRVDPAVVVAAVLRGRHDHGGGDDGGRCVNRTQLTPTKCARLARTRQTVVVAAVLIVYNIRMIKINFKLLLG